MNSDEAFVKVYKKTILSIDNVEKFAREIWDYAIDYAEEQYKKECTGCKQKKTPYKLFGVD